MSRYAKNESACVFTNFKPPNGSRYAPHAFCEVLVGGIGHHPGALLGRDNAILTEPTSSHANCLTARRACARKAPTITTPVLLAGRVHTYPGDRAGRCVG